MTANIVFQVSRNPVEFISPMPQNDYERTDTFKVDGQLWERLAEYAVESQHD